METYFVCYAFGSTIDLKNDSNSIIAETSCLMAESDKKSLVLEENLDLEKMAQRIVERHIKYLNDNGESFHQFSVSLNSTPPFRSYFGKSGATSKFNTYISKIIYQPLDDNELSQLTDCIESEYKHLLRKERVEKGATLK